MKILQIRRVTTFVLGLVLAATASFSTESTRAGAAQPLPAPPPLAQDGRTLLDESPAVQALFSSAWGDNAGAEWIREHDDDLSGGAPTSGPRVAFLYTGAPRQNLDFTQGLARGLETLGYRPGRDVSIVWTFANGRADALPSLATEIVSQSPDVIVVPAVAEATAVSRATTTIPIVFMTVTDPVGAGLAASLEQPGANVTGVIQQPLDFNSQRLGLLMEVAPESKRIGLLIGGPPTPGIEQSMRQAAVARSADVQLINVQSADELDDAFAAAAQQSVDAILVFGGTVLSADRARVVRLATEYRLPTLYSSNVFVESGGLMDYGSVESERGLATAEYIMAILHGTRPADLPIKPPPHSELIVNLAAADAIGLHFPESVLARSTDQIRRGAP